MPEDANTITLATELTVAWLANPNTRVSTDDVQALLVTMHGALGRLSNANLDVSADDPGAEYVPAVSVRKSLAARDRIVSMIDGKPYASLRRHLKANGLTPDQYRDRYRLKADYPMVAPGYSEARRQTAERSGLGRKLGSTVRAQEQPAVASEVPVQAGPGEPAASKAKPAGRKRLGIAGAKAAAKERLGDTQNLQVGAATGLDASEQKGG